MVGVAGRLLSVPRAARGRHSPAARPARQTIALVRAITQMEYAMRRQQLGVFNQHEWRLWRRGSGEGSKEAG